MKVRMLTFASLILFLGVMLGSASAQQSITCTASSELDLVPPNNAVACTLHGDILWLVSHYSSALTCSPFSEQVRV